MWRAGGADRASRSRPRSGARRLLRGDGSDAPGRGDLTRPDEEISRFDLVGIFEQATIRRSGGARAVRVVGATVTRAHEQVRLREPTDGAPEVRAVDREDLELLAREMTHPARDRRGLAVPRVHHGVPIGGETRLALRERDERAEREPRLVSRPALARDGREDVAHDRYAQERGDDRVEAAPEQRVTPPSRTSFDPVIK